jgi:3-phenylpropionate/cinnamic acid dioxygenase small subunit
MTRNASSSGLDGRDIQLTVSAAVHHEIWHFLVREALLLDNRRFDEWAELIANDVRFRFPGRYADELGIGSGSSQDFIEDDRAALVARINRLRGDPGTNKPRSSLTKTRRLITNVLVSPASRDEYVVFSYLLLARNGIGEVESKVFSAERHDRIRRSAQSFKIVRREIFMDQEPGAEIAIDMYL